MKKLAGNCKNSSVLTEGQRSSNREEIRKPGETVQLTRSKVKGTFTVDGKGKCYIYGCESVSDARKLALISLRDINSAMKTRFKMSEF